jgi:hypothetical protein
MTKISGSSISTRNPFGPNWNVGQEQVDQSQNLEAQVESQLFGKKKPPILDAEESELASLIGMLTAYKDKLARLLGDSPDTYRVVLSEGTIAMIDQHGVIYVGASFLRAYSHSIPVLVGVLAHEIGHRPQKWREYYTEIPNTAAQREKLCRLEETRADYFCGQALAELQFPCEPLLEFLAEVSEQPHPEYFPADLRAEVIREGYDDASSRNKNLKKLFPEFARNSASAFDFGTG